MTTITTSDTSQEATPVRTFTVELGAEEWDLLRIEHERLSCDANLALAWNRFLHGCIAIGLDKLHRISASEAFELIDRAEG